MKITAIENEEYVNIKDIKSMMGAKALAIKLMTMEQFKKVLMAIEV